MSFLSAVYFLNYQHFIQICGPKSFSWKLFTSERKNGDAGGRKTELTLFFFSIAFHTYLVFLSFFFFFQVFVTLCVSDLKLDRSVACPLFDMSNFCYCCLQYMGANVASIS